MKTIWRGKIIADGDKKVGKAVPDYIREGRLKEEHVKVWEKEFEDTFESKFIIQAMQNLAKKKNELRNRDSTMSWLQFCKLGV